MQLLYAPYVPNRAEFLILANRRILADQMEFLRQHVSANSRIRRQLAGANLGPCPPGAAAAADVPRPRGTVVARAARAALQHLPARASRSRSLFAVAVGLGAARRAPARRSSSLWLSSSWRSTLRARRRRPQVPRDRRRPSASSRAGRCGAIGGPRLGGAAWGMLGARTVRRCARMRPSTLLSSLFMIAIFAVLQAANPSRYPPAYYAWLVGRHGAHARRRLAAEHRGLPARLRASALIFVLGVTLVVGRASRTASWPRRSRATRERARCCRTSLAQKEALDEANRAKTHFLAAASHDLRQPMQAIVLLVESLQERVARARDARDRGEHPLLGEHRWRRCSTRILDISRFDAGTVKPERSHFRARARARARCAHDPRRGGRGKGLHVARRAPTRAVVETDPVLLYRILANLVATRCATRERGGVLVGCRRRGATASRSRSGTPAPASAEASSARSSASSCQLGNPQRDREQGLGLGLAIVERTAKLLGPPAERALARGRAARCSRSRVPLRRSRAGARGRRAARAEAARGLHRAGGRGRARGARGDGAAARRLGLHGARGRVRHRGERPARAPRRSAPDMALADYRLPGERQRRRACSTRLRARFPGAGGILVSGDIAPEVLREARRTRATRCCTSRCGRRGCARSWAACGARAGHRRAAPRRRDAVKILVVDDHALIRAGPAPGARAARRRRRGRSRCSRPRTTREALDGSPPTPRPRPGAARPRLPDVSGFAALADIAGAPSRRAGRGHDGRGRSRAGARGVRARRARLHSRSRRRRR